ncbi:hypothetical protein AMECASPLE_010787 [Ameca splendens]|uniref:Uncharacterized protein n=1 Tax=Ameca splendens TaxID=208324 RepID=A0ABV0YC07_9TELE
MSNKNSAYYSRHILLFTKTEPLIFQKRSNKLNNHFIESLMIRFLCVFGLLFFFLLVFCIHKAHPHSFLSFFLLPLTSVAAEQLLSEDEKFRCLGKRGADWRGRVMLQVVVHGGLSQERW